MGHDPRTDEAVLKALAPIQSGLEADGAALVIDGVADDGTLLLHLAVSPDAPCEDCFVPPEVMEMMVLQTLADEGAPYTAVSVRTAP